MGLPYYKHKYKLVINIHSIKSIAIYLTIYQIYFCLVVYRSYIIITKDALNIFTFLFSNLIISGLVYYIDLLKLLKVLLFKRKKTNLLKKKEKIFLKLFVLFPKNNYPFNATTIFPYLINLFSPRIHCAQFLI